MGHSPITTGYIWKTSKVVIDDGQILESRLKKTNCLLYAGSTNDIEGRFRGSAYNGTKNTPSMLEEKM